MTDAASGLTDKAKTVASQAHTLAIEQYWPAIERVCREKIGPTALDAARNGDKVADLARVLYPMLPMATRPLV